MGVNKEGVAFFIIAFLLLVASLFFLSEPEYTGLVVYDPPVTQDFIPIVATDSGGLDHISPNGGTVDVSDDIVEWITAGGSDFYIQVDGWNNNVPANSQINNVILFCELGGTKARGELIQFGYNTGTGWNDGFCSQAASPQGTYSCNLFQLGVNTFTAVNSLKVRCEVDDIDGGAVASLAVDYIRLSVTYQVVTATTTTTSTSTTTTSTTTTTTTTTLAGATTTTDTTTTTTLAGATTTTDTTTTTTLAGATTTTIEETTTTLSVTQTTQQIIQENKEETTTTTLQQQEVITGLVTAEPEKSNNLGAKVFGAILTFFALSGFGLFLLNKYNKPAFLRLKHSTLQNSKNVLNPLKYRLIHLRYKFNEFMKKRKR